MDNLIALPTITTSASHTEILLNVLTALGEWNNMIESQVKTLQFFLAAKVASRLVSFYNLISINVYGMNTSLLSCSSSRFVFILFLNIILSPLYYISSTPRLIVGVPLPSPRLVFLRVFVILTLSSCSQLVSVSQAISLRVCRMFIFSSLVSRFVVFFEALSKFRINLVLTSPIGVETLFANIFYVPIVFVGDRKP